MHKNETQFWKWVIKKHVIIVVKFTSEELIGRHTEKKESYESSLTVISYIRNIMN